MLNLFPFIMNFAQFISKWRQFVMGLPAEWLVYESNLDTLCLLFEFVFIECTRTAQNMQTYTYVINVETSS